jgi:aspartate/tyrosine/aromatic aminotransferase
MYERLEPPVADAILEIALAYRQDARPGKIDLGIGVYKDPSGRTPVMQAVHTAEMQLVNARESKAYLTFAGEESFNSLMLALTLGDSIDASRTRAIQTPGGGGAVRLLFELVKKANPEATVWISNPTWINHVPIVEAVGLKHQTYAYLDRATQSVDIEAMMHDLESAKRGDIVLLHGCCHNPTGADLSMNQWQMVADVVVTKGLVPFVDIAYQGFGDGLEEDASGVRLLATRVPEVLIAASCSKNFGAYRDRVGIAAVVASSAEHAERARANLLALARVNYSFPPHHGAAIVSRILGAQALKLEWQSELEQMRQRICGNRIQLASLLGARLGSRRFDFVTRQRGMFSLLGLTPSQITTLREKHALYMPGDGRLNFAGLFDSNVEQVANAISEVLGES